MRDDFCVFILTHGRPDRVHTYKQLKNSGYTGKVFIVIDDEDKTGPQYVERFGDKVLTFQKGAVAKTFDEGDNFKDRRTIVYARNACFDLAKQVGCKFFIELDDDYTSFYHRFDGQFRYRPKPIRSLDAVWTAMLEFFEASPFKSVAMAQGGDFIGGEDSNMSDSIKCLRKAMNSFICSVDRPFQFFGRINEDVNAYTAGQRSGQALATVTQVSITQLQTQQNAGGMTDVYLASGTYMKSFYSVMFAPSCVQVRDMGMNRRIHHQVAWENCTPKIVPESARKA
jgi:hypothetical protein